MLTHKKYKTNLVLFLSDLNKAKIYKVPFNASSHDEIEIHMSFNYLNVFKANEYTQDYHLKKRR